ncbi:hypothetical protein HMPREF0973_00113 [Prevotella veroralis F0319]|uniref:Uncharacterized protein n=1 Tax=Prevotella veroralis F0319 TaxID=649761 RepID=C9MKK5_9BACT|nr:hypothetical protein HMPREF0973_00113 [Prevotella veroralis F0319]
MDRKNHSNRLPLGTPPLGGGWKGFPAECVCPYSVALSLIKGMIPFKTKKRLLRFEEGVSLL